MNSQQAQKQEAAILQEIWGGSLYAELTAQFTLTNTAYTANDVLGGLQFVDLPQPALVLNSIQIAVSDNVSAAGTLYFFNAAPTSIADNAAFAPSYADLLKCVGKVTLSAFTTFTATAFSSSNGANIQLRIPAEGKRLYFYHVVSDTPQFDANALIQWRFSFL